MTLVVSLEQEREQIKLVSTTRGERNHLANEIAKQLLFTQPRTTSTVGTAYPDASVELVRQMLIHYANRLHAIYPQYKDYFKDWQLCYVNRDLGKYAYKGDILLISPKCEINTGLTCGPRVCVTVWGLRDHNCYSVQLSDVEIL